MKFLMEFSVSLVYLRKGQDVEALKYREVAGKEKVLQMPRQTDRR